MRWVELSVDAGVEAVEAVSEILSRLGRGVAVRPTRLLSDPGDELAARPDAASAYVVTAHVPEDASAPAAIDRTERALWHLQAFGLGPIGRLGTRSVSDHEWAESWKKTYSPQRIGRVVVVPSWTEEAIQPGEVAVRLDPGMAFGTGLHPTTRGCLLAMQELEPMPRSILDVGCGSGILAIAALMLGAGRARCYDTDPVAVDAATANARLNGVSDRLEVRPGTLPDEPAGRFDLVLANLVAGVLVDLSGRLARHLAADGRLVASGIVAPRAGEVVEAFEGACLRVVARADGDDWVTLVASHAGTVRTEEAADGVPSHAVAVE